MLKLDPNLTVLEKIIAIVADYARQGGMPTSYLDKMAADLIRIHKCEPAFLGFTPTGKADLGGYPNVLCVSINGEVIHGIPSDDKILQDGDVVKLDCGIKMPDGQYDDGATTVLVGDCSATARKLVKSTKEALEAGIKQAKAGKTNHDITRAIEAVAKRDGFAIIHGYGGHGIGTELHMEPHIANEMIYKPDGVTPIDEPVKLTPGLRIAIEPMFASKRGFVKTAADGWTLQIIGGGIAAHFEKTVTIK
jgi:methionyl aminopeptidase